MDESQAWHAALRWLGQREYAAGELLQRLCRQGCEPELADKVLQRLQSSDCQNERRFAESFLRSRVRRGETPQYAARKAAVHRVDDAVMAQALAAFLDDYDMREACRKLVEKRDPQGLHYKNRKQQQRLMRYLQQKGYDLAMILHVLKEPMEGVR